jgi:hypothetical protein
VEHVARWTSAERRDLFTETAARLGFGNALIMEKDFWVCWTLKHVMALEGQPRMIFKGGTSLSKAFGLIRRFSEDIDLAFHRHDLGFSDQRDPAAPELSRNRTDRLVTELKEAANRHIRERFLPALNTAFEAGLGGAPVLQLDVSKGDVLLFEYPRALEEADYAGAYVQPQVLLELGAKSDHDPQASRTIRPYSADAFAEQFVSPAVNVPTLAAERTFWEKATLLHERAMRPKAQRADRFSRHYHDVVVLAGTATGGAALADPALLRRVAEHKDIFFKVGGGVYECAEFGTLRLVPPDEALAALRTDYGKMREMFFDDPMPFAELLAGLRAIESRINS